MLLKTTRFIVRCNHTSQSGNFKAIILGPPGSGKGTIAKRIVKDFGFLHLASGDVLRKQVSMNTKIGSIAKGYISSGGLVPDDVMMELMLNELSDESMETQSWLLDGFPRTIPQCQGLMSHHDLSVVVNLDVPFDEIVNRVKDRYIHEESGRIYNLVFNPPKSPGLDDVTGEPLIQRHDDKEETVRQRLRTYESKTQPLLNFFQKEKLLLNFKGRYSNEIWPKVHTELSKLIKPLQYTEYK